MSLEDRYFYHITECENVDSILAEGLVPGRGTPLLGEVEAPDVLWLDSSLDNLENWIATGRFKNHVLLRIDAQSLDRNKFTKSRFKILGKSTWCKYQGEIPSEAIRILREATDEPRRTRAED